MTIFRAKKPVFWTFWKLVWRCSEVVYALFLALKDPFSCVFLARKVDTWPLNKGHFDHFQGQKTRFLGFLKVVLEMFRSCLGIIFGLKRLTFKCIFSSKGWYLTSKIKNFGQKLALWEGHFHHFGGQKSRFLDFLKVVLEMLRSWLGIIFGFKRPTFMCIFSSKGRYMTSKIKFFCHKLALWGGHFDHFGGQKSRFFLTFWKLIWSCSEVVWALFWYLKGLLLGVFFARKVDIWSL